EDLAVPPVRRVADLLRGYGVAHLGLPVAEVHAPGAADRGRDGHDRQVLELAVELAPPFHLQLEDRVRAAHLPVVPEGGAGIEDDAVPAPGKPGAEPVAQGLGRVE